MASKPLIVGEMNPYGADPHFALYPSPDGCSGHRLCCLILGMQRAVYLDAFDRTNLCEGKWSMRAARLKASELWRKPGVLILLGSKVASAFDVPFVPFETADAGVRLIPSLSTLLVLPHPSGLCRIWHQPDAFTKARAAVRLMCPDLAGLPAESTSPAPPSSPAA